MLLLDHVEYWKGASRMFGYVFLEILEFMIDWAWCLAEGKVGGFLSLELLHGVAL